MIVDTEYAPSDDDTISSDAASELSIENALDSMSESDITDITIDILYQIDEYIQDNLLDFSSPRFYETMVAQISTILLTEWEYADIYIDDETEVEIKEYIEQVLDGYLMMNLVPQRSRKYTVDLLDEIASASGVTVNADMCIKVAELERIPQPKQKSKEWYDFRHGLLSASSIWKVFGSDSQVNSLIYEKCKPVRDEFMSVNTGSAMHWGVKYEPVTVMVYEEIFNTKVGEFGCIRHPQYSFIGASPDGINIDMSNPSRYGKMLEIKNIVNREITGIPKQEYWIQTQVQMEVCDLDECDFMETRFIEYEGEAQFYADTMRDYQGVILHFIDRNLTQGSQPVYKYMPLDVPLTKESIDGWTLGVREICREDDLVLFTTLYWYLDEYSCVLIQRNREWFRQSIPKIQGVWEIIEKERVEGYEHRAAKKKVSKTVPVLTSQNNSSNYVFENMPLSNSICLIKLDE